jgi:hypothetical protein
MNSKKQECRFAFNRNVFELFCGFFGGKRRDFFMGFSLIVDEFERD